MDVTPWMEWFLGCLGRTIDNAETILGAVLIKARFWASIGATPLNERHALVINRLLDGIQDKLTKGSQHTALRDIILLVDRGILIRGPQGGRSTSYELADAHQAEDRSTL